MSGTNPIPPIPVPPVAQDAHAPPMKSMLQYGGNIAVIVIDNVKGQRRLDPSNSLPQALDRTAAATPVLQWIISACHAFGISDVTYVGGYHIEKVIQAFPEISFRFRQLGDPEAELSALQLIRPQTDTTYLLIRADIVPLPKAFEALFAAESDLALAVTTVNTATPAGMALVRPCRVEEVWALGKSGALTGSLSDGIARLPGVKLMDLSGSFASALDRNALAQLVFRGKAKTLSQLARVVKSATVPSQIRFSVSDWNNDPSRILGDISNSFPTDYLVVRSSTLAEDGSDTSGAGRFHSELDVPAADPHAVTSAIKKVIGSYARDNRECSSDDEILVQQQVRDLRLSGVLLTRDPRTSAPYFVINYETGSGRSDVVTSGRAGVVRTTYVAHDADPAGLPAWLDCVVKLARELVEITFLDCLDLEFAIDAGGKLHLFQARPLTVASHARLDEDLVELRRHGKAYLNEMLGKHALLLGNSTVLTNMSDWNPAEMLGSAPRPLALSLYQLLIGAKSWSLAREAIGYRGAHGEPLIHAVCGRPYVDVRASLNSLLPATLPDKIGARWVDDCLARLTADPALQDKIEFNLTSTVLAPDWAEHADRMQAAGLAAVEIAQFKQELGRLTETILLRGRETIWAQFRALGELEGYRQRLTQSETSSCGAARVAISLADRCVTLGVLPFAILARFGFIGITFLRAFQRNGLIEPDEYDEILRIIPTVAGEFARDSLAYNTGQLQLREMIQLYGHLRPQSYDITSPTYAQNPSVFSRGATSVHVETIEVAIRRVSSIFAKHEREIGRSLESLGLKVPLDVLAEFVTRSISSRERAKFEFMRTVSSILERIASFGVAFDLSREDLSFLTIADVAHYSCNSPSGASSRRLLRLAEHRRKRHALAEAVRLPDVLSHATDVDIHVQMLGRPNFVTRKSVRAPVAFLRTEFENMDLNGKVVAIRAADPGFDWIFSSRIAGLVTEYGGVASHMAIRAAEFGIPAAIGCGSQIFEKLINARFVEIDGAAEVVRPA